VRDDLERELAAAADELPIGIRKSGVRELGGPSKEM